MTSAVRTWGLALVALALALLLGAGAAGCGGTQKPERQFTEDIQAFHNHMRWARYDDASTYIAEDWRWDFLGEYEELGRDFEVTEYEVRRVDHGGREGPAIVTVWVQFFRLPETRVHERTYVERWMWNDDRGIWEMVERRTRE